MIITDVDVCPKCNGERPFCDDSRNFNGYRERRRHCQKCGFYYRTIEIMMDEYEFMKSQTDRIDKAIKQIAIDEKPEIEIEKKRCRSIREQLKEDLRRELNG